MRNWESTDDSNPPLPKTSWLLSVWWKGSFLEWWRFSLVTPFLLLCQYDVPDTGLLSCNSAVWIGTPCVHSLPNDSTGQWCLAFMLPVSSTPPIGRRYIGPRQNYIVTERSSDSSSRFGSKSRDFQYTPVELGTMPGFCSGIRKQIRTDLLHAVESKRTLDKNLWPRTSQHHKVFQTIARQDSIPQDNMGQLCC